LESPKMGKRILNRKELRADYEAAERRGKDEEDEVEGEEEEEEDEEEADADDEASDADDEAHEDEEETRPPKKRKAVKEPKAKTKPRARTPKIVRVRVVWGVFNNSNQRVAVYEYPKRKDAEDHAAKLTADKKSTHFVQPVKEPIEVKKDE
jgi:hypothetical protein